MIVSRVIDVQKGDPVGAVRGFLRVLLDNRIVDCVFAPMDLAAEVGPQPQKLSDADALETINPLLPLMLDNAAIALKTAMAQESCTVFGAMLRPCEVRALIEMAKRGEVDLNHVVIVGVDCLATYDEDFYHDVSAHHPDAPHWLMNESLRFARQGQITPYRYRLACQMCVRPAADHTAADVLLGVVGVDAFSKILVLADESNDVRLKLHKVTDRPATEREVAEREVALWRLTERRNETAERKLAELGLTDTDTDVILALLNECTLCGACMDACPICDRKMREALEEGCDSFFMAIVENNRRLASCDGCGMCQTHCSGGIPLAAINRALSRRVQTQLDYVPGRDVTEIPPWMT